jgi:release factor glutamine methyltransferase
VDDEPVVAVIRRVAQQLADAGVDSPRADAEQLVAYVLGIPRGRLVLAGGLTAAQRSEVDRLAAARAERVPLQHLTGTVGFCRLELAVGE